MGPAVRFPAAIADDVIDRTVDVFQPDEANRAWFALREEVLWKPRHVLV